VILNQPYGISDNPNTYKDYIYHWQNGWPKINILKGNHFILRIRGAPVRQKLGIILENKVVQKLKLEKNVFFTKNGLLN